MKIQPGQPSDLHGSAPDTHPVALLLIDVVTDFEHVRGEDLLCCALPVAPKIAALVRKARAASVPVVYVNDNFGRWRSDFKELLEHCLSEKSTGREFVRQLQPEPHDYFVLKPKHSGFYQTPLELLLKHLGAETLVLAGVSTNSCVLFTANDAYMRDMKLYVPSDCVAACSAEEHEMALREIHEMLKADISMSTELDFEKITQECVAT